jgi:hypothetical protein
VVYPRGEHKDVGAVSVSGKDVGDDLLEPGFVGDECSVDLGHSAWGAGIGLPGVAELGGVYVEDRMWCEPIGFRRWELARSGTFQGHVMGSELVVYEVFEPVAALGCGGARRVPITDRWANFAGTSLRPLPGERTPRGVAAGAAKVLAAMLEKLHSATAGGRRGRLAVVRAMGTGDQ